MLDSQRAVAGLILLSIVCSSPLSVWAAEVSSAPAVESAPVEVTAPLVPPIAGEESKITAPEAPLVVDDGTEAKNPDTLTTPAKTEALVAGAAVTDSAANSAQVYSGAQQAFSHVDEQTGAFTYAYEFDLPQGRSGLQPQLGLTYNSNNLQEGSLVGYGWSLSQPTIERLNKGGLDTLYTANTFASSLAGGELVPDVIDANGYGTYLPRLATPGFVKFERRVDGSWKATDPNGLVYTFGTISNARVVDTADAARVYSWYVESIEDTNGNGVHYTYTKLDNQVYPDSIKYTTKGADDGIYAVNFFLEDRADDFTDHAAGFLVTTNKRIARVEVTVNAALRKKFELAYSQGNNGRRSVLTSVTPTAYSDTGVASVLPAMTTTNVDAVIGANETAADPTMAGAVVRTGLGMARFADLNGDGLVDMLSAFQTHGYPAEYTSQYTYLNTNAAWTASSDWTLPVPIVSLNVATGREEPHDACTQVLDVNGDSRADVIYGNVSEWLDPNGQPYAKGVYLNTGSGWAFSSTWTLPVDICTYNDAWNDIYGGNDLGVRFVDVNGDGLVDLVKSIDVTGGTSTKQVYFNTGSGWTLNTAWTVPITFTAENGRDNGVRIVDVNGDGLADLVQNLYKDNDNNPDTFTATTSYLETGVYLNTGTGWVEDSTWVVPPGSNIDDNVFALDWYSCTDCSANSYPARFADINGDNLPDLVDARAYGNQNSRYGKVYFNTGHGWQLDEGYNLPGQLYMNGNCAVTDPGPHLVIIDTNADGVDDYLELSQFCSLTTSSVFIAHDSAEFGGGNNYSVSQDVVKSIQTPTGGTISVEYNPAARYRDGDQLPLNSALPIPKMVMSKLILADGLGHDSVYTYAYEGGRVTFDPLQPRDRKFSGFKQITVTRPDNATVTRYFHQNDSSDAATYEGTDSYGRIGFAYREELRGAGGNLTQIDVTPWMETALGTSSKFVAPASQVSLTYNVDGVTHRDTATAFVYSATTGNLTSQIAYGKVTSGLDGVFTDSGTDVRTTVVTYATDATGRVRARESNITTTDNLAAKANEQKFTYDGLAAGSVTLGNLTKEEAWISGAVYATSTFTYDTYGNILTVVDPNLHTTTNVYDGAHQFVATQTNHLSQSTQSVYDAALGQPTSVTSPNGGIVQTTYDGFGRPLEERLSTNVVGVFESSKTWTYNDTLMPRQTVERHKLDATVYTETVTYTDGWGRPVELRILGEDNNNTYLVTEKSYDVMGNMASLALPFASTGSAYDSASAAANLTESYVYDALLRRTATSNVVGTTTVVYDGHERETVTDPLSKVKEYAYDGQGRLTSVVEHLGANAYTTSYLWNGNDKLTKVTDAMGNIRNFTYDGLGRRLTAQDLHATNDAAFGTWTFAYDAAGNLTSSIDPTPRTVTRTYDALNRILTEDDTSVVGVETTYAYDTCTNGIGALCTATTSDATTAYVYDKLGRPTTKTVTISAVAYPETIVYDRQGGIVTKTLADNSVVRYTYNYLGKTEGTYFRDLSKNVAEYPLINSISYAPHGQPQTVMYANGVQTVNTYDANELYRLRSKVTTKAASNYQNFAYTYDLVGNVTQIADNSSLYPTRTVVMTYDDLYRLTNATQTSPTVAQNFNRNFTYNILGDITSSPAGVYLYQSTQAGNYANPHAPTKIGTKVQTYDRLGNLLTDAATFTYAWDYASRLKSETSVVSTRTYSYDYEGTRVKKVDSIGGTISTTPSGNYDVRGLLKERSIDVPEIGRIATITYNTSTAAVIKAVHHLDHLGSESATSNGTGVNIGYTNYFPFGATQQTSSAGGYANPYSYLGSEKDAETGLQYLQARYYNSVRGVFLSQDPVFWELGVSGKIDDYLVLLKAPQFQNSYSYSLNNPYTYSDPQGRQVVELTNIILTNGAVVAAEVGAFVGTAGPAVVAWAGTNIDTVRDSSASTLDRVMSGVDLVAVGYAGTVRTVRYGLEFASSASRGFRSFSSFKYYMGAAGAGKHWHHIVEQTGSNLQRFGANAVHNTQNLTRLNAATHRAVSAYYSRVKEFTDGQTVRQWLSGQSYEKQLQFGIDAVQKAIKGELY